MDYGILLRPSRGAPPAVRLAAKELACWLSRACPPAGFRRTGSVRRADFVLGTFADVEDLLGLGLSDDRWVDEIVVRSAGGRLVLAGSNPRSVLFAVYSYLEGLGFAWVVPGPDGEVAPRLKKIPLEGYDVRHRASLTYRGIGLAGAFDGEMGAEFVEWMARNRLNHLFLEGDTRRSSYQQALGRKLTMAEARRHDRLVVRAAKERGLIYEHMGHGWTAWTLGFPPGARRAKRPQLSGEALRMASEIGGVRGLPRGRSGNTQLCLSNPASHRRMTEIVCRYAEAHPEIDVLSVWMADGFNNWCECSRCTKVHPSNLWARLINRMAREVYRVRPELRLEVLGYSVLMEPPPAERIDNSRGNVVLMFAPFLRCYLHTLDDPRCITKPPLHTFPPVNKLHHPMNREFFRFFEGWRRAFEGSNYVFDYYCWLPIKRDIFEGNVPETICRDFRSYPRHGITGCVDCSRAQSFWPTPLARWLYAHASWDASTDYASERQRLLELTFGGHAGTVARYLDLTYECLLPERHGREEERGFSREKVRRYKRRLPAVRRALDRAVRATRGARRKFLRRVAVHADFTLLHLNCLLAEAAGRYDQGMELAHRMHALARRNGRTLAGAADPPELGWLEQDTVRRLEAKKNGTYRRIP